MLSKNIFLTTTLSLILWGCSLPDTVPRESDPEEQVSETLANDSGAESDMTDNSTDSGTPVVNPPEPAVDAGESEPPPPVVPTDAGSALGAANDGGAEASLCDAGYALDGGNCVMVDLCEGIDCGPGACVSDGNGLSCDCANGYQDNDNNLTCELTCATANCGLYYVCDDSSGTSDCVCAEGTELINNDCEPILCEQNQFVSAHECITCEGGLYNTAGDSAYGDDTTCDAACLDDSHCSEGQECNQNNECFTPSCTSHQQCIDQWAETPSASTDYACVEGSCSGLASGKCYEEIHCMNDTGKPYCDGDNNTLGDCVACIEHEHCIYNENDDLINTNGSCNDGLCESLAPGYCYIDAHCSDDSDNYCLVGHNSTTAGECKECVTDADCDELFGGPPNNPNYHHKCNDNYDCVSVQNGHQ